MCFLIIWSKNEPFFIICYSTTEWPPQPPQPLCLIHTIWFFLHSFLEQILTCNSSWLKNNLPCLCNYWCPQHANCTCSAALFNMKVGSLNCTDLWVGHCSLNLGEGEWRQVDAVTKGSSDYLPFLWKSCVCVCMTVQLFMCMCVYEHKQTHTRTCIKYHISVSLHSFFSSFNPRV